MKTDIEIMRIDPEAHIDELVALAKVEYGDSEIADPEYLHWQYLANPAGKAIVVVARAESGQLAGQYIVIPVDFRIRGEAVRGALSLNTLTHPDFRGQGLFTRMANETYAVCESEGLLLTLGFPNKNSYPGFVRKLQFRHIGNASVMFRPLDFRRLLLSLPRVRKADKYSPSSIECQKVDLAPVSTAQVQCRSLDFRKDAAEYDQFMSSQRETEISVYKSAAFCAWRFQEIPTRSYNAYQARAARGILATCVVRQRRVKGVECVFLIDLQVADGADGLEAGRELVREVLRQYRKVGVALAGTMANPGSRAHQVVRALRFREMPSRLLPHDAPIIVRKNAESLPETAFDLEHWAFSFGDYDVF